MDRKLAIALLLTQVLAGISAQDIAQFDALVDFDRGLRELGSLLEQGRAQEADLRKLYILTGTVADVTPKAAWFFALEPEDILDAAGLVGTLRRGRDALSIYLRRSLSPETARLLESRLPVERQLLEALLKDLNAQIRSAGILASGVHRSLSLSPRIAALLGRAAEDDERGLVSRLLLEEAFAGLIAPVELAVELVTGEWIGNEEVKSYHAVLRVRGPQAYEVFVRRRASGAGGGSPIAAGDRVVTVASLLEPVELPGGVPAWLAECHRIRTVR